jgi:hypothetical protein
MPPVTAHQAIAPIAKKMAAVWITILGIFM